MTVMNDIKLIIFGTGGHGKVVADIAMQAGWKVVGFIDDNSASIGTMCIGLPVFGDRSWLCTLPRESYRVAMGIGDNLARMSAMQFLDAEKLEVATIISPSAIISPYAQIGSGTVIVSGAVVNAMAIIGDGVIVNTGAVVGHNVKVENYAHLSAHSTLGGGAEVGEFTHIALGATILPLLRIGSRSILGAGSVATRSIPDDVIAYGVPARIQRNRVAKGRGDPPALPGWQ